jgi:hypothetical protein
LGASALLWAGVALAAKDPAAKCESGKLKEAGQFANCLLKAESKAARKGGSANTSNCDSKFQKKWSKLESKAGGVCPSEGDQTAVQDYLADSIECLSLILSGGQVNCGTSLSDCPAGTMADGASEACWLLGALGESCDTACANVGLVYDPATAEHAGDNASGGTLGNCLNILRMLDADNDGSSGDQPCGNPVGCAWMTGAQHFRCNTVPSTADASDPTIQRACACQ